MNEFKKNPLEIRAVILLTIAILLTLIPWFSKFLSWGGFSNDPKSWDEFGGYFGGVAGVCLQATTIYLLVKSITLQKYEFESLVTSQQETISLLSNQSTETIFFKLLENHHEITKSISGSEFPSNSISKKIGRDYFYELVNSISRYFNESNDKDDAKTKISDFLLTSGYVFSHYISNIKLISNFTKSKSLDSQKDLFLSTLLSQLSLQEKIILGYFGEIFAHDDELRDIVKENGWIEKDKLGIDDYSNNPLAIKELLTFYI